VVVGSKATTPKWKLFKLYLAERDDPVPFYRLLAAEAVAGLGVPLQGQVVVDLGCGPGHYTRALRAAGAQVLPVDLDPAELELPGGPAGGEVIADAGRLPLADARADGVFCSNMLEHTPEPIAVVDEVARVVRPGGWAWLSWTNWLSPVGGHDMTPFHYLGPRLGLRVHERLRGSRPKNAPGTSLFPLHVGRMLRVLRAHPDLELRHAVPRYYPSQSWVVRVPGLRELATWNCAVFLRRRP
jgi:SAM-dependent methyltransferase